MRGIRLTFGLLLGLLLLPAAASAHPYGTIAIEGGNTYLMQGDRVAFFGQFREVSPASVTLRLGVGGPVLGSTSVNANLSWRMSVVIPLDTPTSSGYVVYQEAFDAAGRLITTHNFDPLSIAVGVTPPASPPVDPAPVEEPAPPARDEAQAPVETGQGETTTTVPQPSEQPAATEAPARTETPARAKEPTRAEAPAEPVARAREARPLGVPLDQPVPAPAIPAFDAEDARPGGPVPAERVASRANADEASARIATSVPQPLPERTMPVVPARVTASQPADTGVPLYAVVLWLLALGAAPCALLLALRRRPPEAATVPATPSPPSRPEADTVAGADDIEAELQALLAEERARQPERV